MKKKVFVAIATVLALIVMYFVGSGFMKNTSAIINDYRVSADGKEITLNIGVASSIGYIRDVKVRQQYGGKLYLDCYSAFGGLNGGIGAKESFTFELNDDTTIIAIYRNSNAYEEVLVKAEDGSWQCVK